MFATLLIVAASTIYLCDTPEGPLFTDRGCSNGTPTQPQPASRYTPAELTQDEKQQLRRIAQQHDRYATARAKRLTTARRSAQRDAQQEAERCEKTRTMLDQLKAARRAGYTPRQGEQYDQRERVLRRNLRQC